MNEFSFPLAYNFKEPWVAAGEFATGLEKELRTELTEQHPLYQLKTTPIAQRLDADDALFEVHSGDYRYVEVHLTWSGRPEPFRDCPTIVFYKSIEAWNAAQDLNR